MSRGRCDMLADIDGDEIVSTFDLDPFIAYLTQGAPGMDMDYTWDAENRLTAVTPVSLGYHSQKEAFKYDYLGRRVEKRSWTYDGGWGTPTVRKYVWAGWLMLMELDGDDNPVRKYTWGLDLGGQSRDREGAGLEAAGGIGGLLAMRGTEEWDYYIYLHDGSGNVGQLVWWQDDTYEVPPLGKAWSASVRFAATYEYDPYGNVVTKYGWFPDDNAFRFSTKYYDSETAMYYFGARYYRPWLGRFINRDPIEEAGGMNLYAYLSNDPTNPAPTTSPAPTTGPATQPTTGPATRPAQTCAEANGPCPPGFHYEGTPPACTCVREPDTGGANNLCRSEWSCCACALVGESSIDQGCYTALVCVMQTRQRLSSRKDWSATGRLGGESGYCKQAEKPTAVNGGVNDPNYRACCSGKTSGQTSVSNAYDACQAGCPNDPTNGAQYWGRHQADVEKTVGSKNLVNGGNGNCRVFQVPGCTKTWFAVCQWPPREDGGGRPAGQ